MLEVPTNNERDGSEPWQSKNQARPREDHDRNVASTKSPQES